MTYNTYETKNSNCPNTLNLQVGDREGAQEEPYVSVQSACVQSGNPQTGSGLSGLVNPAQVNKTPKHVSLKADDIPGRGLHKSNTDPDPFRSLTFKGVEAPKDHSTRSTSETETSETSDSLSDKEEPPEPADNTTHRKSMNKPRKRPSLKIMSLNMRGHQKDGKDKMRMVINWMHMNQILI